MLDLFCTNNKIDNLYKDDSANNIDLFISIYSNDFLERYNNIQNNFSLFEDVPDYIKNHKKLVLEFIKNVHLI